MKSVKKASPARYYIVINLGLRSIRAVLYDEEANVVEKNWFPVQTTIHQDQVEQDPSEWWSLCVRLLHQVLDAHPECRSSLRSITVTSSACCLVVADETGNPLMGSLLVSDKRSSEEAVQLKQEPSLRAIFEKPNNLTVPSFMFPKILWIKQHKPDVFKKTTYFMSSNDYLLFKLSGKLVTDPLNAEKFYFDQQKNEYPPALLKYVGVKKSQLPAVRQPAELIGGLTPQLQKELKLEAPVQVILSTYDAICAFLGSGVSKPGQASNVCGTVTSVRAFSASPLDCSNGVLSQSLLGFHIIGGSNNIDGGLLEWSKQMFYGDSYPEKYVYRIMGDEAEMSQPGAKGLIFSPYIIGERLPFFDSVTRGIFFGLERFHSRSDVIRSIFEASAYMVYDILQSIESSGLSINEVRMSGGLTNTRVACSIRADITGKKVTVIDEVETTAMGAYFILLLADKKLKDLSTIDQLVKVKQTFVPDKKNHEMYKQFFSLFKKIHAHNKELMEHRKMLIESLTTTEKHLLENL